MPQVLLKHALEMGLETSMEPLRELSGRVHHAVIAGGPFSDSSGALERVPFRMFWV